MKTAEKIAAEIQNKWWIYYTTHDDGPNLHAILKESKQEIQDYAKNHGIKTEEAFRTHFKEQGFELYKTEDLKPKLDSLETLNRDLNSCVNALTECANNHPEGATYINIMLVGIKGRLQKLNELLSTHKTQ
jgi:hypothetical protein